MLLDRSKAPDFQVIENISPQEAVAETLPNGLKLHHLSAGVQPVCYLELMFEAGTTHAQSTIIPSLTFKMLAEGTQKRSAGQISEYMDNLGAFWEVRNTATYSSLVVYAPTKHLAAVLTLFLELVEQPSFPEESLHTLKQVTKQGILNGLQKTAYVASKGIREATLGATHPVALTATPEEVDQIGMAELEAFYQTHIRGQVFEVFVAGALAPEHLQYLRNCLGALHFGAAKPVTQLPLAQPTTDQQIFLPHEAKLQSSIRVGRVMFPKNDPNFFKVLITNELFGGYFGSRLMKNIREDKGYTYGISSQFSSIPKGESLWIIGTDVKAEFAAQTLAEINGEIRKLQEEPVATAELELVRNYMRGAFAGSINSPFELMNKYKGIYLFGLDYSFFKSYFEAIATISPDEIQQVMQQYFDPKMLHTVVAGAASPFQD
ncbi:M16 family metallopeptidase [Eisenibacter elegans]|uniref:M16 family metallopeptidase n=1 Tax=Eisenibacter elegans TaxID=997 RepID=UPI0004120377|nr:pitrilysin family protein [Eisenibacter elegans]